MTRRILIFGSLAAAMIVGLVFGILALLKDDGIDPNLVAHFCERNPAAIVCTEDGEYTNKEFATEMFKTMLETYSEDYDDEFCDDYFTGHLVDYCMQSKDNIMPTSTNNLSMDFEVTEVSEGIYDVATFYNHTGNPAWTFRIAIVAENDIFVFSGLSYQESPPVISLELTDQNVHDFMVNMIITSTSGNDDFCETYFAKDALELCEETTLHVVPDPNIYDHSTNIEYRTNKFIFTMFNSDDTISYMYTIKFEEIEENLVITDLEVEMIMPQ